MDQRPISARPLIATFFAYLPVALVWSIFSLAVTLSEDGRGAARIALVVYMWLFFPVVIISGFAANKAYRAQRKTHAVFWATVPGLWLLPMAGYLLVGR
jgi:hypothetical protein